MRNNMNGTPHYLWAFRRGSTEGPIHFASQSGLQNPETKQNFKTTFDTKKMRMGVL